MYYVQVRTRSSGAKAKGTPDQAIDYITDGHDSRRDSGYSDAELRYIARMGAGWKTDLEGGRVPLVGFGTLAGEPDQALLRAAFNESCKPCDPCATTGYKSFTFTIPKEVSLFAEGHREQARQAIYAAVGGALERAFPGKEYTAVAAIHTRNEAGEIHHHVHVLVGKFARDRETGKVVSLNGKRGGNGPGRVRALKAGWKEAIDREFKERLGLGIEQSRANGPVALIMPDGTRLEPLNRNSRRVLEKEIAPTYTVAQPTGAVVQKVLKFKVMDERIFEVAAGDKGKSGWAAQAFTELFPEQSRYLDRYEKRVETLKAAGYLTAGGKITPAFRVHYALRQGILTPELQRIRLDLARQHGRKPRAARGHRPPLAPERTAPAPDFWTAVDRDKMLRRRVERLGFSREEVDRIRADAERLKPTPERLGELRLRESRVPGERAAAERALGASRPGPLFVRVIVPPLPRGRGVLSANAAPVHNPDPTAERTLEDDVRKFAESFLLVGYLPPGGAREVAEHARRVYAREVELPRPPRREGEPTPQFRPMVSAVTTVLARNESIAKEAIERCARIGSSEIIQRVRHAEMARAYREWREAFLARPLRELQRQASALERSEQKQGGRRADAGPEKVAATDLAYATDLFKKGLAVLRASRPAEASRLERWTGNEDNLVREVLAATKGGTAQGLPKDEFQAAVKAGRIGHLLESEAKAPRLAVPPSLSALAPDLERLSARLHALGVKSPLGREEIRALPPVEIRQVLDHFRREGVLVGGGEWALRGGAARRLAEELRPTIERGVEADQHLIDRLIAGRSRST